MDARGVAVPQGQTATTFVRAVAADLRLLTPDESLLLVDATSDISREPELLGALDDEGQSVIALYGVDGLAFVTGNEGAPRTAFAPRASDDDALRVEGELLAGEYHARVRAALPTKPKGR